MIVPRPTIKYIFIIMITLESCAITIKWNQEYMDASKKNSIVFYKNGSYQTKYDYGMISGVDSGHYIKGGNLFHLSSNLCFDTFFCYSYLGKSFGNRYGINFETISQARNDTQFYFYIQDSGRYKVNGVDLDILIRKRSGDKVIYFKDSVVCLEFTNTKGERVKDYLPLRKDYLLDFNSNLYRTFMPVFFKKSLNGNKISEYHKSLKDHAYYPNKSYTYKLEYFLK